MNMALFPGFQGSLLVGLALALTVLLYAHYSQFQQEAAEAQRRQRLAEIARSTILLQQFEI